MSIGTTISASTPARTTLLPPRESRLNQASSCPNSSLRPSTSTTLSKLDHLLLKQQSTSPPQQQQQQQPHLGRSASTVVEDDSNPSSSREYRSRSSGSSIFNALNLHTVIPSLRNPATEAMSPRSLTNLQLLLKSPRPSPKSSIATRWRLFHGAHDWAGLLDPLDENLRRELVRYGEFVQAAYHAFHSNPAAQPSEKRHIILNDRSYRVTRSLYATSSVELPKWLDGVAPWMTQRSSWIGYVAVCDNVQEIQRMGRRDIVISLRGTSTCMEWAENVRAGLVPLEGSQEDDIESKQHHHHQPKVANGFYSLYKTRGNHVPSLSETVIAEVRRLIEQYKGEELSISITGHSLGAALALLLADELSTCLSNVPPTAVFSFGGPKVGNKAFEDRLARKRVKVLRVVNASDVVTRVPGVLPREELRRRLPEKWGSHVLEVMDTYVHVGSELRVDSKASPYLRPNADPACCHDLESYLHLVDGFLRSDCPFRSDAKRSLVRLLDQQRPNVKRLYVSQAKLLVLDRLEPAGLASPSLTGLLASPSA